jgi:hypothetical protein
MTKRFPGNMIDPNITAPGGPGKEGVAPGMWSLDSAMRYHEEGIWPVEGLVTAGQAAYAYPGNYTFIAPPGITNVSAVTIGSGCGNGGGGGELRYRTSMTVIPGNSYSVVVGAMASFSSSSPWTNGGYSQFNAVGSYSRGNGGYAGGNGGNGGSGGTGDGGGNGGRSGGYTSASYHGYRAGGAGAGGYSGTGGNGGTYTNSTTFNGGTSGSGGAGGGGCSSANGYGWGGSASRGGGTGLGGAGANGAGAPSTAGGAGISPPQGGVGSPFTGVDTRGPNWNAGAGGGYLGTSGAVRIIWGGNQISSRAYPSTNTGDYNV